MKNSLTKKVVLNGLMIALVFLVTYTTKIPGPVGPFNIGDSVIIVTAILLGRNSGFFAGAFGSAIADLAMGYGFFAPFTFLVKGLEGYVVGLIANKGKDYIPNEFIRVIAAIAGAVVMISGYFLCELTVLRLVDNTFGFVKAIQELPFNIVQGGVSAVVGYLLSTALLRTKVNKYIFD